MNTWLLELMVCPRHHTTLTPSVVGLTCLAGCSFPIVDGVPVMLLEEVQQTMDLARTSIRQAREPSNDGGLYVESVGLSEDEKRDILHLADTQRTGVDSVVSFLVGATNGIAYKSQVGNLKEYPIPNLPSPRTQGQIFLDIGCNWGRWCVAASRRGYKVVGIDPSLGAIMAAKRVAHWCGVDAAYVVGDARFLPFMTGAIEHVFSYSVLQHLSKDNVSLVVSEISRVLKEGGVSRVQMPTKFGLRCIYHQLRRRFRDPVGFEVRYWSLPSLQALFGTRIGTTTFSVDCFFGIGLQFSDLRFMTPTLKVVVAASEGLRLISRFITPLKWAADSVYVSSIKDRTTQQGDPIL